MNIFADIRFVKGLEKYLELSNNSNYKDPFTGRKPSAEAISFAKNAITLFKAEIEYKKFKIFAAAHGGKMSRDKFHQFQKMILYTEGLPAKLPTPNSTDR